MRLVLDTNVVVSALISRNEVAAPRLLLNALVDTQFTSVASRALVDEWHEVARRPKVRRYARLDPADTERLITRLAELSELLDPPPSVVPAPDPGDAHLWALLACDRTCVLVTGDVLLLEEPFAPERVITPVQGAAVVGAGRWRG